MQSDPNRSSQGHLGTHSTKLQGSQDRQIRDGERSEVAAELSLQERRRREDAVRFANASISLEGFKVSAAEHAHADRFIAGQIDLNEFLRGPNERDLNSETSKVPSR